MSQSWSSIDRGFEVKSTAGHTYLEGKDFSERLPVAGIQTKS